MKRYKNPFTGVLYIDDRSLFTCEPRRGKLPTEWLQEFRIGDSLLRKHFSNSWHETYGKLLWYRRSESPCNACLNDQAYHLLDSLLKEACTVFAQFVSLQTVYICRTGESPLNCIYRASLKECSKS